MNNKEIKLIIVGPLILIATLILFALIRFVEVFFNINILTTTLIGLIINWVLIVGFIGSLLASPILIVIGIVLLVTKNKSKQS